MKAKKKVILPKIDSKPKYTIELNEDEMYSLGGWLKENAMPLLQTAAGGVLTATGVGAGVGAGLLASGIGGMVGNALAEEPETIDYSKELRMPRTVGKQNMTPNVMQFGKGGKMKKVMDEWDKGELNIGKSNKKVPHTKKGQKQAIAIALSYKDKKGLGGEFDQQYSGDEELMQLEGPKHNEGGIQFMPDAELEGGESVYKGVVNSDQIKITKEIANQYGLPKTAINKTPAEYSDIIESNYKGREIDPFAQTSKEMELNNIAKMSVDLKESIQQKESNKFAYGGSYEDDNDPSKHKQPSWTYGLPAVRLGLNALESFGKKIGQEVQYPFSNLRPKGLGWNPDTTYSSVDPRTRVIPGSYAAEDLMYLPFPNGESDNYNQSNFSTVPHTQGFQPANIGPLSMPVTNKGVGKVPIPQIKFSPNLNDDSVKYNADDYIRKEDNMISKVPTNLSMPDLTPNTLQPFKGNLPEVADKIVPKGGSNLDNILGLVPLAVSAFQTARTNKEGYDKVKLGRVHAQEYNPALLDPSYQLDQVSDTFATGNEQMSQVSRKDYLRRRIQSATEESKTKSGILGQIQGVNTQMLNQAKQFNLQSKSNADTTNLNMQIQEENINAGNKGAWETARDYQLSNLGTMAGEYGRDLRLEKANEDYNNRLFEVLPSVFQGQTISKDDLAWRNTDNIAPMVNSPYINTYNSNNDPHLYNKDNYIYGDETELGIGINNYPSYVNRSINSRLGSINNPKALY